MNILALGSHPDDIEVFCAGTLLKYKHQGHNIFIGLTTSGNIGSNEHNSKDDIAAIREEEQQEAAKILSAEVKFLRFDDQCLLDSVELRRAVLNTIRWANPDVVFTNPPWDSSTDHAITGKVVSEIILSLPGKLVAADMPPIAKTPSVFYWDTAAGINFIPETYVDISDVFEKKMEALSKHKSQYAWLDTFQIHGFLEHVDTLSKYRGLQAGYKYAEGFAAYRLHGFMPDFRLLP